MRGTIEQRSRGSWRVRVSAGFDPVTGKRRQITATVRGTRRDAERQRTDLLHRLDQGPDLDPRKRTLAAYLQDEWLPAVEKVSKRGRPLAPTTRRKYADAVARIVPVIGRVKLADLRPLHIERLRDELLAGGTLAPQSVGDVLRVVSQALRKAVAKGAILRNVADADMVDRPAGKPAPFVLVTPELADSILRAVRGTDPWDVAAHLALGVTLRREEVLGLRWSDVDLEAGRLTVSRTVTFADGRLHEGDPKSAAGERTLELPAFVAESLRRHRARQAERRLVVGEAWVDRDFVVDRGDGEPWSPPSFSKGWSRFAAKQGFGDVTFHGLRHGAATLLLAAGVPDAVTVRLMGHADTRILRLYQDVVPELLRDAAVRMDNVLGRR